MKLLIILLCMLLERYGNDFSHIRQTQWFKGTMRYLEKMSPIRYPWAILSGVLALIWFIVWIAFALLGGWLFGGIGALMQAAILFYCMGPEPIFKPGKGTFEASAYFVEVNEKWFALVFWYIVLGVFGVMTYRVITWMKKDKLVKREAAFIADYLEWIPARLTSLLYLLVGHFQSAFPFWTSHWMSGVHENASLLAESGIRAVCKDEKKRLVSAKDAEELVWYASILMLVCVAFLILGSWL